MYLILGTKELLIRYQFRLDNGGVFKARLSVATMDRQIIRPVYQTRVV